MKGWRGIGIGALSLLLLAATAWSAELLPGGEGKVVGRYIVVLERGADPLDVAQEHMAAPTQIYRKVFKGFAANLAEAAVERLLADQRVDFVEPDGRAFAFHPEAAGPGNGRGPNKDKGGDGGGAPQTLPWGVIRVGGPLDGSGLTAWIIDTGIDSRHDDLNVDRNRSANFVSRGRNSFEDGNGHGTHVAGTVAALDNEIDVVGVAAGATLVAVRVLDNSGSGFISWVVAGIDYVAANAAPGDVANMSLGAAGHFESLHLAVEHAADQGIRFAVAAGNDGNSSWNYEPAHVENGNVFSVSAIDDADCLAWFSNFDNPPIDFAAPGVEILSTSRGGGTETLSGTSMASPHLAGLLLLGEPIADGSACNDPDGNGDPIAHH